MRTCDALIVGGGPAGSSCARTLRRAGWNVVVLDRARFPRDKVCGGWVTPGVFRALDLEPADYRSAGLVLQEITGFRTAVFGQPALETVYGDVVSYAIRRCEFDNFLLRRAHVCVLDDRPLGTLTRHRDRWIVNDELEASVVIGAGGHFVRSHVTCRGNGIASTLSLRRKRSFRSTAHQRASTGERRSCSSAVTSKGTPGA